MVLEKDNAIADLRKLMGATNPANAEEGTIRKKFAGRSRKTRFTARTPKRQRPLRSATGSQVTSWFKPPFTERMSSFLRDYLWEISMQPAKSTDPAIDNNGLSKVAAVTFTFWIIKILCTTLGETGGDAVTMSMNLGYLVGTLIFAAIFLIAVIAQVLSKKFHPFLYWFTIIATTTVGTTMADLADRSEGLGYAWGSALLLTLVLLSLGVWYWSAGTSP